MTTVRDIVRMRMVNQRLTAAVRTSPEEAVGWFGAMQSQELAAAPWSIGDRSIGTDDVLLRAALDAGSVLRTHMLRPTWHFVSAADIRWVQSVTAPRVHQQNAFMYRQLGIGPDEAVKSAKVLVAALEGGRHLPRADLGDALGKGGMPAEGMRLAYFLMHAELDGLLCSGPLLGGRTTYALLEERVPGPVVDSPSSDEGLARLAARYFQSHGPATIDDFRWWSSLTASQARKALEIVGPALRSLEVEGRKYWLFEPRESLEDAPRAHLLQGYDEYIIGYRESRDLLDIERGARSGPASRARFTHAVVVDSQFFGHWRRKPTRRHLALEMQLLRRVAKFEWTLIEEALERMARFFGLPASIEVVEALE